jgi:hypothetical protein
MNKSQFNNTGFPGFTAEASLHSTEESHYFLKNDYRFCTSLMSPASNGCPGCAKICIPCNKCLSTASNPINCSSICRSCWACDCPPPRWPFGFGA